MGPEVKGPEQEKGAENFFDEDFGHLLRAFPPGDQFPFFHKLLECQGLNLIATVTHILETDRDGFLQAGSFPSIQE